VAATIEQLRTQMAEIARQVEAAYVQQQRAQG